MRSFSSTILFKYILRIIFFIEAWLLIFTNLF